MISLDGLVTVLPGNTHTPLGGRYHLTDWLQFYHETHIHHLAADIT